MAKSQTDRTVDQANEFRKRTLEMVEQKGWDINQCVLAEGRENDITPGAGPRYAIVKFAQKKAREGATYGEVIKSSVPYAKGKSKIIGEGELLGYVIANDYCKLMPPGK